MIENTVAVNQNKLTEVVLYPNPVKNVLFLEARQTIQTVKVYNLLGKKF